MGPVNACADPLDIVPGLLVNVVALCPRLPHLQVENELSSQ
jgi:hypothetical protein